MTGPEATYRITYLTGELKLRPIEYRFTDNGDGTGRLDSEFSSVTGDNEQLISLASMGGFLANPPTTFSRPRKGFISRLFGR